MPLYEYACRDCERTFEVLQRLGEGPDGLVCPRCGGGELVKQFSTFASSSSGKSAAGAADRGAPGCGAGFT